MFENTIYQSITQKNNILENHQLLIDHFWVNFFGFSSLYKIDHKNSKLRTYLRGSVYKMKDIDDLSNDLALLVRIMKEKDMITGAKSLAISKFLTFLKSEVGDFDENEFKDLIKKINLMKVKPSQKLKTIIENFTGGYCSLNDHANIKALFMFCKHEKIGAEFIDIAKHMMNYTDEVKESSGTLNDLIKVEIGNSVYEVEFNIYPGERGDRNQPLIDAEIEILDIKYMILKNKSVDLPSSVGKDLIDKNYDFLEREVLKYLKKKREI